MWPRVFPANSFAPAVALAFTDSMSRFYVYTYLSQCLIYCLVVILLRYRMAHCSCFKQSGKRNYNESEPRIRRTIQRISVFLFTIKTPKRKHLRAKTGLKRAVRLRPPPSLLRAGVQEPRRVPSRRKRKDANLSGDGDVRAQRSGRLKKLNV